MVRTNLERVVLLRKTHQREEPQRNGYVLFTTNSQTNYPKPICNHKGRKKKKRKARLDFLLRHAVIGNEERSKMRKEERKDRSREGNG